MNYTKSFNFCRVIREIRDMFLERLPEPMRYVRYGFSKRGEILVCVGGTKRAQSVHDIYVLEKHGDTQHLLA